MHTEHIDGRGLPDIAIRRENIKVTGLLTVCRKRAGWLAREVLAEALLGL